MRSPAVAGSFYPMGKKDLENDIDGYLSKVEFTRTEVVELMAAVIPHAGYMYSGQVAAYAFKAIDNFVKEPPVFVLICPNHTGNGSAVALSNQDWMTPLGKVRVDTDLVKALEKNSTEMEISEEAHQFEHSIEVQLPFLQRIYGARKKEFKFVPICMMGTTMEVIEDVGRAIFKSGVELNRNIFVIASSDMTHYEDAEKAKEKDNAALKEVERIDYKAFVAAVEDNHVSVCGYAPVASMLVYAKLKNAKVGRIIKYGNSGDVSGDYRSVVAYASVIITK
ncbi:MAG: MEMO1 family protein [Candidatus Micrarchaeota archaeon]